MIQLRGRAEAMPFARSVVEIVDDLVAACLSDRARNVNHLAPVAAFTELFGMVLCGAPAFESVSRLAMGPS